MIVYKGNRPVQLSQHQVDLIKRQCAKDATPDEFELFMTICKKSRLDPFKKQIYCLIFTGEATGRNMVIITGIDGFRTMAARDYPDFAGTDEAVFEWSGDKTPLGKSIPSKATVTARRKGGAFSTASAYWEEFAPADLRAKRAEFWNKMPKVMLEKVAEARALRKAFPGLGNIFTQEEMDQKTQDYTEDGAKILVNGRTPSGEEHPKAAQARIVEEKKKDLEAKIQQQKAAAPAQPGPRSSASPPSKEAPKQERPPIDVKPESVAEVWPKEEKKPPAAKKEKSMAGMQLTTGTIHNTVTSTTKEKHTPVLNVKILNTWYKCYRTSIFDILQRSHGYAIEAWIDPQSHNLVGLKRIGGVEFEADGKTEKALDVNREAGNGRRS